jgi:hypothetical protein
MRNIIHWISIRVVEISPLENCQSLSCLEWNRCEIHVLRILRGGWGPSPEPRAQLKLSGDCLLEQRLSLVIGIVLVLGLLRRTRWRDAIPVSIRHDCFPPRLGRLSRIVISLRSLG